MVRPTGVVREGGEGAPGRQGDGGSQVPSSGPAEFGCGAKFNNRDYAGFSLWFQYVPFTKVPFLYISLSHCHLGEARQNRELGWGGSHFETNLYLASAIFQLIDVTYPAFSKGTADPSRMY